MRYNLCWEIPRGFLGWEKAHQCHTGMDCGLHPLSGHVVPGAELWLPHPSGEGPKWDPISWFFLGSLWTVMARFCKGTKESLLKLFKSLTLARSFFFLNPKVLPSLFVLPRQILCCFHLPSFHLLLLLFVPQGRGSQLEF